MKITRKFTALTVIPVAAVGITLAACGSAPAPAAPSTGNIRASIASAVASALGEDNPGANPVPILATTGVSVSGVTASGDAWGDLYASGSYADGEQVTAYTFATAADENRAIELNSGVNDPSTMVCTGHLFQLFIQGVETTKAWTWPVPVATIAQRTGCREGDES
jgi:hypothetical protein